MNNKTLLDYQIDHIEIYTPMAKTFAFWHMKALKFSITACANADTGKPNLSSYLLTSGNVRLVLTSTYPGFGSGGIHEVTSYVGQNYCGVRRIALHVPDVSSAFERSISGGAIPLRTPLITRDDLGYIEEASIKLFDHCEIILINRESYSGTFKPGFQPVDSQADEMELLKNVDHIASEVRVNEGRFWSEYLSDALGISLVQTFKKARKIRPEWSLMLINLRTKRSPW